MGKFLVANEDSNLRALEFKVRPFTTGIRLVWQSFSFNQTGRVCELIKSKYKGTVPKEKGGGREDCALVMYDKHMAPC